MLLPAFGPFVYTPRIVDFIRLQYLRVKVIVAVKVPCVEKVKPSHLPSNNNPCQSRHLAP
jgi:hypothetical protein